MYKLLTGVILGIYGGISLDISSFFNIKRIMIVFFIIFTLLIINKKREVNNQTKTNKILHKIFSFLKDIVLIAIITILFGTYISYKEKIILDVYNIEKQKQEKNIEEKSIYFIPKKQAKKQSDRKTDVKGNIKTEEQYITENIDKDTDKSWKNKYKRILDEKQGKSILKIKIIERKENLNKFKKSNKKNNNNSYNTYIVKILEIKENDKFKIMKYINLGEVYGRIKTLKKLEYGNTYSLNGVISPFEKERNYKGFNSKIYNNGLGIYYEISNHKNKIKEIVNSKTIIGNISETLDIIRWKINEFKEKYAEHIKTKMKNSSIFIGLITGETGSISEETKDEFKNTGIYHLLAISGSHIVYVVLIVEYISKKQKSRPLRNITKIFAIMLYIQITSYTASVMRAGYIVIFKYIVDLTNKKTSLNALMQNTLFIILITNPYKLFDLGLHLSYGGVIGILLYDKYIKRLILKKEKEVESNNNNKIDIAMNSEITYVFSKGKRHIFKILKEIIALTISVQIVLFPIIAYNFNTLNLNFILGNVIIAYIIENIIFIGMIIFIILIIQLNGIYFLSIFTDPVLKLIDYLIEILTVLNSIIAKIRYSNIYIHQISIVTVLIYYFVLYILIKTIKEK